jgi:hypothetical protein
MLLLGAFGALIALIAALFLPVWPALGLFLFIKTGDVLALGITAQAIFVFGILMMMRARVARAMSIPAWYAWTTPLGAGIFAAMMLTSAWKVISGTGVTWKGRLYQPK